MAGTMFTGCQSSSTKVENAQDKVQEAKDKVIEAKQELNQTIKDSIQQFKKESQEQINANEKSIAEFKVKIAKERKENRAEYERQLTLLEQKNNQMKKDLEEFREDQKDKWDAFRFKFKHDMAELGKAFKNFTVKNK